MTNGMRELREQRGETLASMAKAANCSVTLLGILEDGGVTTPLMAKDIAKAYGMNREQRKAITCERRGK